MHRVVGWVPMKLCIGKRDSKCVVFEFRVFCSAESQITEFSGMFEWIPTFGIHK